MTLEVKHTFNCTIATDPAATSAGKVTPDKWNEAHTFTQATGKILGRKTAGAGATEELSTAEALELIGTCARGDVLYRGASAWERLAAGASDGMVLVTEGSDENPRWGYKNAFAQASAPTAGDDSGDGFEVGSCWFTTGGAVYICTDATLTAAIWLKWLTPAEAVPVGTVSDYAGATAPSGWLLCYGQAISRTTYSDLFAIVSTTYGAGDGSTTFNVPDLRGRVVAGQDDMGGTSANRLTGLSGGVDGDVLGGTGGTESHTLTEAELPTHSHTGLTIPASEDDNPDAPLNASVIGNNVSGSDTTYSTAETGSTGNGDAHNNVQPTLILNKIIKY